VRQRWSGSSDLTHPIKNLTWLSANCVASSIASKSGLTHRSLLVADQMGGAEVDDAVLREPQARRRRGVEAVARAVDLDGVIDQGG
jgi:hypothetical protein